MKELKVIHGMSEVAGQGIYTVQGLRANGVDADMAVWRKNPSGYDVDIDLHIGRNKVIYPIYFLKMWSFARKAQKKYNVLHAHFGYSLMPFNWDINKDIKLGIKIFAEFHGSDIRHIFNDVQYRYYSVRPNGKSIPTQRKRLKHLIEGADGIILHDAELMPHLPKIDIPVYIVPLRVDMSKFEPVYIEEKREKPIIVHAPSKRSTKGTEQILEILDNIDREFELILVEGKTQEEAFEIYKKADIIIDQVSVGSYGVFAIEAMALGKPVITYISDEMKKTFPTSLPIVSAGFEDMKNAIERLIDDFELRKKLGKAGREYVERYHDTYKVTKYLKDIYTGECPNNNLFELL